MSHQTPPAGHPTTVPTGSSRDTDAPGDLDDGLPPDPDEGLDEGLDDERGQDGDDERQVGFLANVWGGIREIIIIALMAIVLSFVVKTWLIQAFYIPSGSMENTLQVNDRVIVSKLTPGPIDLQRGDIVVFEDPDHWLGDDLATTPTPTGLSGDIHRGLQFVGLLPDDSDDHLIKRVIGLPGDHVVGKSDGSRITVNGVPITENYVYEGDAPNAGGISSFDITVPAGKVWVMGDHRGDSSDSRYHDNNTGGVDGSVPISDITGRAVLIVWPVEHVTWLSVPESTYAKVPAATPKSTSTAQTTAKATSSK